MPRHHIIPRSRCHECGIRNPDVPWNITEVPDREHSLYHALFLNKTPSEIITYLMTYFWNDDAGVLRYQTDTKEGQPR